jgi:hypothetical protein
MVVTDIDPGDPITEITLALIAWDGNNFKSSGSAIVIGPHLAMTAKHVVEGHWRDFEYKQLRDDAAGTFFSAGVSRNRRRSKRRAVGHHPHLVLDKHRHRIPLLATRVGGDAHLAGMASAALEPVAAGGRDATDCLCVP